MGNGASINIWEDSWIPNLNGYTIITRKNTNTNVLLVKDLLDQVNRDWNINKLEENFNQVDQKAIRQIRPLDMEEEDRLVWGSSQDGSYSVKSGYYCVKAWERNRQIGSSTAQTHTIIWKNLLKTGCTPRQQTLLWRVIKGLFPVRERLNKKGVNCTILCPICLSKIEFISHCFKDCKTAKMVWFSSPLKINFKNCPDVNFRDWIIAMLENTDKDSIRIATAIIDSIWIPRNLKVFEDHDSSTLE